MVTVPEYVRTFGVILTSVPVPHEVLAMKIDQYYLECLSQASYLIADESSGLAAVVDPRRDIDEYLRDAEAGGPDDRLRDRDALPRRLPVGPPGAGRGDGRRDHLR